MVSSKKKPTRKTSRSQKRSVSVKRVKRDDVHFARVTFGRLGSGTPGQSQSEIILFVKKHLPAVLKKMGEKKVGIQIERLEPLDAEYTHLHMKSVEIRKRLIHFSLTHGLHHTHNHLVAVIPVSKLSDVLRDYDILFDLYFTDLSFHAKSIKIEFMDPFFSAFLVKGKRSAIEKFVALANHACHLPVKMEKVDHPILDLVEKRKGK